MTTELWLAAICISGTVGPLLLGLAARRRRPEPVPVRVQAQRRPVNRSIER
ncbi:hypothetical protein [Agromyces subbeticus]|uniref:hypothetical protein n=1 Tax=Agromyces subbeticus TaxID=293890 RepID=UPI0003B43031|nr:hypothetical protein [Agromyces subbeticus]